MTDSDRKIQHSVEATDIETPAATPELDGSVDALVANLRAAKVQLAGLLEAATPVRLHEPEDKSVRGRSAA